MAKNVLRCVAPHEINADALLAYSRGNAPAVVADHLGRCQHCRDRVRDYAVIERKLRAQLYRRGCPDTLTLGEYALGMLPTEQLLTIAEHLVECPHCAAESRGFTSFFAEPDTPPVERSLRAVVRRLVALPLVTPRVAHGGLRGGADETVAYTAEGIDIFVSIQRESRGRGFVLAGMLQTAALTVPGHAEARLLDGNRILQTEPIDDLGSFFFGGVAAGDYRIEVRLADAVVELESIAVA